MNARHTQKERENLRWHKLALLTVFGAKNKHTESTAAIPKALQQQYLKLFTR